MKIGSLVLESSRNLVSLYTVLSVWSLWDEAASGSAVTSFTFPWVLLQLLRLVGQLCVQLQDERFWLLSWSNKTWPEFQPIFVSSSLCLWFQLFTSPTIYPPSLLITRGLQSPGSCKDKNQLWDYLTSSPN